MEFLTGLLIGVAIGFLWGVWRATQSFIERIIERPEEIREIMDRVNRAVQQEQTENTEQEQLNEAYTTEWHDDVCYLYDSRGNFMAQGSTVIEAMSKAEQRFPGMKLDFRLNESNKSNQ